MGISPNGINLIKKFEGCKLNAYLDQAGVPTIGYGSTEGVRLSMTITQDEAEKMLKDHLDVVCHNVSGMLKVEVDQNQFDALCSFAYNLGCAALKRSTLLSLLNQGDFDGAAEQFPKWCMAGGVENAGLKRRRIAEQELFLS